MSAVGHNYDSIGTAEDCLLGALLIGEDSWDALAKLRTLDFKPAAFSAPHRSNLYEQILKLADDLSSKEGAHVLNTLAICEWVDGHGTAEACGGFSYISKLADSAASLYNIDHLAGRIAKHEARRRLAGVAAELATAARDPQREVDSLAVDFAKKLAELPLSTEPAREETAADLISAVLWARNNKDQGGDCWPTGIENLDRLLAPRDSRSLGGLVPERLYIVAGRPKHGKSALGLNIATNMARAGHGVHIDSLEMSSTREVTGTNHRRPGDLAYRIAQLGSALPYGALAGDMRPDQYERLHRASFDISAWKLTVDSRPNRHYGGIFAAARRRKARDASFDVLVVDYAGLVRGDKGEERRLVMGEVSRGLKALAKELSIAVILIAQLNRGCEERADRRPVASDLKESGDLEQDADAIILVQQPGIYPQWEGSPAMWIRLDIYRHGPPGEVCLTFDGSTQRISGPTICDPVKSTSTKRSGSTAWKRDR